MIFFAGVLACAAVVVVGVSYKRAHSVVEPIKEMTTLVEKMAKQDFTRSVTTTGAMYEEIGTTIDALLSFQEACRFGNRAFIRGDLNRALANYQNLLEISKRLHIEVGEQTMYLNIGNVFRQRGETGNAMEYYENALSMANSLLAKAKADGVDERDDMDRVASAYHNIALVHMDKGEYDEAMSRLEDAQAIDETLGNKRGLARRYDAMGLVMMRQGRNSQAESKFKDAMKAASAEDYDRGMAYIACHTGELYKGQSNWTTAESNFQQAVDLAEKSEELWLEVYAMQQLAEVMDQLDEPSHEIRRKAEQLRRSIQFKKSVVFVIDYSGSMGTQDRLKAAVAGAREILDSQVNPQDDASIITFNITVQQVLPLTQKGDYKDRKDSPIHRALDGVRYPDLRTAFFDALGKALEDLNKIESSEHRWVIALTDGQDNSSVKYSLDALEGITGDRQRKVRRPTVEGFIRDNHLDVNLIIIGVGEELKKQIGDEVHRTARGVRMTFEELLKSVCASIPQGKYLSVVDSRNVQLDIEKAFQEVGVLMAQLELGGATDEYRG
jgi:tetratricopeptide (TPR) repeat protein